MVVIIYVHKKKTLDNERMNDKKNVRGESFDMKLGMANIEVKQENIHLQKKERKILGINSQIQLVQRNLERMEQRAMTFCKVYDKENPLWKKVEELEMQSDKLQQELSEVTQYSPPPKRIKLSHSSPGAEVVDVRKSNVQRQIITIEKENGSPPLNMISVDNLSSSNASISSNSNFTFKHNNN